MNKEFCTYEQALALKELGFDEPCFGYYTKDKVWQPASYSYEGTEYPWNSVWPFTTAPLYQQAFRFFREKYKLAVDIKSEHLGYYTSIVNRDVMVRITIKPVNIFETYEEAELACLNKLIEIIKLNKQD